MKRKGTHYEVMSVLFICALFITSCKKEEPTYLTSDNLTSCENCETRFNESSRLDGGRVVDGNAIVFQYKSYWSAARTAETPYNGLFFEVPNGVNTFDYDQSTIASDKVVHVTMCIWCNTVPLKPVDGILRGERISKKRWLVEAAVALATPDGRILDTLAFKHYFTR